METTMPDTTAAVHYARKPLEVAAARWSGSNVAEMTALLGNCFDHDPHLDGDGASVLTSKYSAWTAIYVGTWALLAPGGVITVMDDDDFAAAFAEVAHA